MRRLPYISYSILLSSIRNAVIQGTGPNLNEPFQSSSFHSLEHVPCVSLFHRQGRIGCGTKSRSNQKGIVLHWTSILDKDELGEGEEDGFVAIIPDVEFNSDNVKTLLNSKKDWISGILILNSTIIEEGGEEISYFNPASQYPHGAGTPEEYISLHTDVKWNPTGDGMMYDDYWGIPMAFVSSADMSSYLYSESVSDEGVSAKFNYYMGPEEMTSKECLGWNDTDGEWRPKCLPLGGQSVWSTLMDDAEKEIIWLTTSIDATSMFHDASPGASTAASNILTLLLTAQILGEVLTDNQDLADSLNQNIGFAFFQGEQYGYLGSRNFFSEVYYPGFTCDNAPSEGDGCLYPLRPSLSFQNLPAISSILAIDQIALPQQQNTLYVHGTGGFVDQVLLQLSSDDLNIEQASIQDDEGNSPIPPSPLTSALSLSQGDIQGAVLAGYDDTFSTVYMTHLDISSYIDLQSLCITATIVARAALALAYEDGGGDYQTATEYALQMIPDTLSSESKSIQALYHCLFYDGKCSLFQSYIDIFRKNEAARTNHDLGEPTPLGTPPNYYISIFDLYNSQPMISVGTRTYGAYTGSDFKSDSNDSFLLRPKAIEVAIYSLLNDYLSPSQDDATSCSTSTDCASVQCSTDLDTYKQAVCTASTKQCICPKSQFHLALDRSILPAPDEYTGMFVVKEDSDDYEYSNVLTPIYTEPYWSNSVGVMIYRRSAGNIGYFILGIGVVAAAVSFGTVIYVRSSLKMHKLY